MKAQKLLFLSFSLLFSLFALTVTAQSSYTFDGPVTAVGPHGVARCSSVETDAVRRMNNPDLPDIATFEEWLAPKVADIRAKMEENPFKSTNNVLQIPVVVHVLHNGEPIGTAPNISDAQVQSQIQVLNEDFRRMAGTRGFNNDPVGADTEIEFVLAQSDEEGNSTNGISRRNINQDGATRDDLENTIKPATIWDPTMFLNMWSVKFAAPDDNLLGYAQFPGGSGLSGMPGGSDSENPDTDGVVMRFNSFGTKDLDDGSFLLDAPYDLGRTATHEVGHWVGLRHIWGDGLGCNLGTAPPACSCNQDDFCEDTPNSEKANYSCDGSEQSTCEVPMSNDMTANYMDYSSDDCMNIFTLDQKARILAVMTNSPRRMELPTSTGLLAPAPRVSFAETRVSVEEGSSCNTKVLNIELKIGEAPSADATVTFSASGTAGEGSDFNFATATVIFPSGSTANRTLVIDLNEDAEIEGNEEIIITIDNVAGGNASTASFDQACTVIIADDDKIPTNAGVQPGQTLFNETFTGGIGTWTTTTSPGAAVNWRAGTPAGGIAESAYVAQTTAFDAYKYDGLTEGFCRLESPAIDASNARALQLTFDYQCFGETGFDFGSLLYSTDNGANYRTLASYSDQATATQASIDLPADAAGCSELKIAFLWVNDALVELNPPFNIDNVKITGSVFAPAEVNDVVNSNNPTERTLGPNSTTYFYDELTGKIMLSLTNNSSFDYGCVSVETDRTRASAGQNAVNFWNENTENALLSQTYFLTTENTNPNAGATFTAGLYYNNNDVQSWEMATGNSRNDLEIVRLTNNRINEVNSVNAGNFTVSVLSAIVGQYNTSRLVLSTDIVAGDVGLGAGIPGASGVLPVAFTDFSGEKTDREMQLYWVTAQELNNDYFILERSANGIDYKPLGIIKGAGTTDTETYYAYNDTEPLPGKNYYRLQQTDLDGTISYSHTIVFTFERTDIISVYPNPTKGMVFVNSENPTDHGALVSFLNLRGELIEQSVLAETTVFDTSSLPEGIYFIRVQNQAVRKLIVKR